jgi:tetratricopeptide (TPR) repeat protein
MQGRWGEALEAADALLGAARDRPAGDRLDILGHLARALALLGAGRADDAADAFEASARGYEEFTVSRIARDNTWYLTHAGTARAAAGDTAALASLIERVETEGSRSLYARDQRLHHYLRGLLARLRGAPETEVEAHLRAALYSLSQGYSRINLELAESLLRQGRYDEAVAVARAQLHASMESNGMYTTRTDFHELLGRIWYAGGVPDSAAVHLRAARDAWRAADPIMQERVANVEGLLATL